MKILRRIVIGVIALVVVAYAGAMAYMYFMQRSLEYDPTGKIFAITETKLAGIEEVKIPTGDGATLAGWYHEPAAGQPVILFYKGNAGSYTFEHPRYEQFEADGYGFLAFDYRGFPSSPGSISQTNILADSLAAFDWLKAKGHHILIWGRSLGSGPATYVASRRDADALLLETPFDSAIAVANDSYWFLPVSLLMQDQYPVDLWIRNVKEPVFVAHGTADTTIPVKHGQRVYDLAPNKGGIWIEPGGTHGNLWERGLWGRAATFFADAEKAAAQ